MKKLFAFVVLAAVAAVVTGCTSVNTSDAGSMNVYPETVGPVDAYRPLYKVDATHRVEGSATLNVLFGLFTWGDTSRFADNSGISLLPSAKNTVSKSAFYNACVNANCDAIVAARYEISTTDYFIFKKMIVKVKGFPATLTGVETVKPMPYYIDGKGQIVVLDKFVLPHCLFNIYTPIRRGFFF